MRAVVLALFGIMLLALAAAISGGILQLFWNGEPLGNAGGVIGAAGAFSFEGCLLLEMLWAMREQSKAPIASHKHHEQWQTIE